MQVKELQKKITSITPKDGDLGMEEKARLMRAYDRHCREMFPEAFRLLKEINECGYIELSEDLEREIKRQVNKMEEAKDA